MAVVRVDRAEMSLMDNQNRASKTTVDIIVVLVGVVMVLIAGYITNSIATSLLKALGTGLVAAGFVAVLMQKFHSVETDDTEAVRVIADNRIDLEGEYTRRKQVAHEVNIVSIALAGALDEFAGDPAEKMIKRVLFDRAKVRLMFLSPTASYVKQRAVEDGVPEAELSQDLQKSVRLCSGIHARMTAMHKRAIDSKTFQRERMGALEIRVIDMCPHYTIFHTDERILWGIYTSTQRGYFTSVLQVTKDHHPLYAQLVDHFDGLWNKGIKGAHGGDNYLVKFYGPNAPTLNEDLFSQILGPDWRNSAPVI